ncbi:MAG: DUF2911 domain-containing protein [Chitinophagaceae bacterium]|jgi:hypothetical protein|nr:DUF2911 domain-containing protein [Chitinophagaceae bacterium]
MNKKWMIPALVLVLAAAACKQPGEQPDDHSQHNKSTAMASSGYADSVNSGLIATDTLKGSPRRMAMANVGSCHVHMEYGSPGVKNRTIWGGLVAYGQVWATGAHKATSISFACDVEVGGQKVPAGKYALFTIPDSASWTVIINKRWDQHLADDYNAAEDVVRLQATPQAHATTQRLSFAVKEIKNDAGEVIFSWEKVSFTLPFRVL